MNSASTSSVASEQEYRIRAPKIPNKKHLVMKFANDKNIDFRKWTNVKLERENNLKEYKGADEEQPKFGAGSEFGREQREEARKKKYGIITKKYKSEDQPWLMKIGGKGGKKYKGVRDGGITENVKYYVFMHGSDGSIEAYPLQEWYNFHPIQRYKTLSAEEAEEAFVKRNKTLNYFSVMYRKKLKPDAEIEDDGEEKGRKTSKMKDLQISEMDEWMNSSDDSGGDSDREKKSDDEDKKNKKKKAVVKKKKKKQKDSDDEAVEESDDGDEEGREHEYISDSSESDSEIDEKGVAEEDALKKMLTSDEESDEEEKKEEDQEQDQEKEEQQEKKKGKNKGKAKEKKKNKHKYDMGALIADSSSELSSDSTDNESKPPVKKETSRSGTPTTSSSTTVSDSAAATSSTSENNLKRKSENVNNAIAAASTSSSTPPPMKKARTDGTGEMEEAVRRYLTRKPMTTTELLQKFKSKRTGMSSQQLVDVMTQILKRINPHRQTIKGKMYLSIKAK